MSDPVVRGTVHLIEETKTYGQKGFRKRLIVLEQDNGRFTNYIPVDFVHEGCDAADQLNVGDEVDVVYRLSGRRWQRDPNSDVKFFLSAESSEFRMVGSAGDLPQGDIAPGPHESEADWDDGEAPF